MAVRRLSDQGIVDFTNSNIPDPGLRQLIFGTEDIDFHTDINMNPIGCINRCLVIAWLFSFVKWKNEIASESLENDEKNSNELRICRSFNSVYGSERISLDLIFFTLTEMQLDVINHRHSDFRDIIDNRIQDFSINQLRQLIRVWKHSYKLAETNHDRIMEFYIFVIQLLPILNTLQIEINNEEVLLIHKGIKYPSFGIIQYFDQKAPYFYYLSNYQLRGDRVNIEYSDIDGSRVLFKDLEKEDFFSKYNLAVGGEKISAIFAQKLYSVDYKYIHNLSLAVSDIIDDTARNRLFDYYAKICPDAFRLLDIDEGSNFSSKLNREEIIQNSNWDNVIAILMLEAGPSSILEKVINKNKNLFEILAENLEVRFGKRIIADDIISEYERKQREESELIRKISSDFKSLGELLEIAQGNLMVQTIIRAVTKLVEDDASFNYNAAYVETLNMRIKNLEKIIRSNVSDEEKTRSLNKALEKTLHFLIAFYYGLIEYAKQLAEYQDSSDKAYMTDELIKNCEHAFLVKAYEKVQECQRFSVGQSLEAFRELSKLFCSHSCDEDRKIQPIGELLSTVIGRDYLCDVKTFNKISKNIASTMNSDKHYQAEDGSLRAIWSDQSIDQAKELLYFFIYNKDYMDERRLKRLISLDPIYPYVVRYSVRSENRDGFDINNYVVNLSSDEMDLEVKLLTEKDCQINELYYCIPNLKGTLPKWWIKPFLIKCRDFDELFVK
jgi:hypothetical protein